MEVDALEPSSHKHFAPIDDFEKQTNEIKVEQAHQFEKNYPKNIFIPIIEFLAGMGYQTQYEDSVGTRQQFEGKNVVSLTLMHHLLSESWFLRGVNKRILEANISNKILLNSKIKKKLFHLKAASILLHTETTDPKAYKKLVSRKANLIASTIVEND